MHKQNAFITLTYSDEHLPKRGNLEYTDFQKFMKRLRKEIAPSQARFYMCGEYGGEGGRPHFHACLFGHDWDDKKYWKTTGSGEKIYRSARLERLWPFGHSSTANVTFESAAYVARYCVQKITGYNAKYHYARADEEGEYELTPEFNKMSLKPGIGATWLNKYKTDVYPHDYVIINGKEVKPPKYYDEIYEKTNNEQYEEMKEKRLAAARERREDNTDERLAVKEQVATAQLKRKVRTI